MYKYVQSRVLVFLKLLLVALDFFSLNWIFLAIKELLLFTNPTAWDSLTGWQWFSVWVVYNMAWLSSVIGTGLYRTETVGRLESMFRATWRSAMLHLFIFAVYLFVDQRVGNVWLFVLYLLVGFGAYYLVSRLFMTYAYTVFPKRFNWYKRVAVIGQNGHIDAFSSALGEDRPFYSIDTIAYKESDKGFDRDKSMRRFKQYFEEVSKSGIHDVFIVATPELYSCSQELVEAADFECVQLNFVPAFTASISYNDVARPNLQMDLPVVMRSHEESMSNIDNRLKKRIVDLLISGFVMVFFLSWMIPIIGLIIKIQNPGPIFFKQLRSGRNNKPFYCYKFRSMVVNRDSDGKQATKNDKRITKIGAFLRKTNLDEFPQFINVFLGDMSVVGPRPHMLSHTEHYSRLIQHYMVRHFVKPGITGWAQVNGYRGETKEPELMAKRVEYDIDYMRNWSAALDFKIVCMTAINMIRGEKNAY